MGKINFRKIIFNNFWLKLFSLITAILLWLFVNGEITKGIRI